MNIFEMIKNNEILDSKYTKLSVSEVLDLFELCTNISCMSATGFDLTFESLALHQIYDRDGLYGDTLYLWDRVPFVLVNEQESGGKSLSILNAEVYSQFIIKIISLHKNKVDDETKNLLENYPEYVNFSHHSEVIYDYGFYEGSKVEIVRVTRLEDLNYFSWLNNNIRVKLLDGTITDVPVKRVWFNLKQELTGEAE